MELELNRDRYIGIGIKQAKIVLGFQLSQTSGLNFLNPFIFILCIQLNNALRYLFKRNLKISKSKFTAKPDKMWYLNFIYLSKKYSLNNQSNMKKILIPPPPFNNKNVLENFSSIFNQDRSLVYKHM